MKPRKRRRCVRIEAVDESDDVVESVTVDSLYACGDSIAFGIEVMRYNWPSCRIRKVYEEAK